VLKVENLNSSNFGYFHVILTDRYMGAIDSTALKMDVKKIFECGVEHFLDLIKNSAFFFGLDIL